MRGVKSEEGVARGAKGVEREEVKGRRRKEQEGGS